MSEFFQLTAEAYGVPAMRRPVYWNTSIPISANLMMVDAFVEEFSRYVPVDSVIDEAAIMVPSRWHANQLILNMGLDGWEHFNGADDLVFTNPFGTRYVVRYEFLRHPDHDYRLEVMYMGLGLREGGYGFSPLHQALWAPDGVAAITSGASQFPIPHLSFKAKNRVGDLQPRSAYSRAVAYLQAKGCIHAQTCQSTYGVFGYYLHQDTERQLYIKPRLNTRDGQR